jgi:hypothetical protein
VVSSPVFRPKQRFAFFGNAPFALYGEFDRFDGMQGDEYLTLVGYQQDETFVNFDDFAGDDDHSRIGIHHDLDVSPQ